MIPAAFVVWLIVAGVSASLCWAASSEEPKAMREVRHTHEVFSERLQPVQWDDYEGPDDGVFVVVTAIVTLVFCCVLALTVLP